MKFAKYTFLSAAIYGILVTLPLYFIEQRFWVDFPPALNHTEYYYSFVGVTLVWQILFIFIALSPVRYRLIMIPCFLEKMSLLPTFFILFPQGRFPLSWIPLLIIDVGFGILFFIAFIKSRVSTETPTNN